MFIPIALAVSAFGGLVWYLRSRTTNPIGTPAPATVAPGVTHKLSITDNAKAASISLPNNLVQVQLGNDVWMVAPEYIGPIGIGEAADLAKSLGMELPTPALVDAIWRQADLKLLPMPRQNIVSQAVFDDQKRKIQEQIAGRSFTLLGGCFKDIVVGADKFPQLYGWHVEDGKTVPGIPLHKTVTAGPGKVIQPLSGHAHGLFFKDYSQGVRLVKKVTGQVA